MTIISLHTILWFQVLLRNTNNLYKIILFQVAIPNINHLFAKLFVFMYYYPIRIIFKRIYSTLTDSIPPGQSGFESNSNEGVVSTSSLVSYPKYPFLQSLTPLQTERSAYFEPYKQGIREERKSIR